MAGGQNTVMVASLIQASLLVGVLVGEGLIEQKKAQLALKGWAERWWDKEPTEENKEAARLEILDLCEYPDPKTDSRVQAILAEIEAA